MTINSLFIDPESGKRSDSAIIDTFSFLLPCKAFNIKYTISKGKNFPITYEFILRFLDVNGSTKIDILANYFGFSATEIATELDKLLTEKYIEKNENKNEVQLSKQGKKLFVDGKPELVKIEDKNDKFSVELISFNLTKPQKSQHRQAFINLKLNSSETERVALSNEKAKESFKNGYYQYIDKGNNDDSKYPQRIRKIDSITALYPFSMELRANLELKLSPSLEADLQLPKLKDFNDSSQILRIIRRQAKEMLSNSSNDTESSISTFVDIYEDEKENFIRQYITQDKKFNFTPYIKDVFIEQKKKYRIQDTQPIIGSPLLSSNFEEIIELIKLIKLTQKNEGDISPLYWIRPSYPFWARSEEALENMNKAKNEMGSENQMILFTDQQNAGANGWDVKRRYKYYFGSIIEIKYTPIFQNIEIILSPNNFVCGMYYHTIKDYIYRIPFGLLSKNPEIVKKFQNFVKLLLGNKVNKILHGEPPWGQNLEDTFRFESQENVIKL